MIEFEGSYQRLHRVITGCYSFDKAFGNDKEDGFPVKAMCEISGPTGIGKSTVTYWLSAKIASDLKANIAFADLETLDYDYLSILLTNAGYSGKVKFAEGETDGDIVDNLVDIMKLDEYGVGILDSLGAISPVAEVESSSEAANMGRRAKLAAQFSRKLIKAFRDKDKPSVVIFTNHMLPIISLGGKGMVTSGGNVKNYLSGTQMRLSRKEETDDGSYMLEGKVTKNRFGYHNKKFLIFSVAGFGVHTGLTAVKECKLLGYVPQKGTIKLDGKSYGFFNSMIKKHEDKELFQPFIDALKNNNPVIPIENGEIEDDAS